MVGRLFVGVPLDDEVRYGLAAHLTEATVGRPLPGRPTPPENWHFTLRFLGRTDPLQHERLLDELGRARLGAPFRLGFGGLGAFPRASRANVLWLGVEEGAERLQALAGEVEEGAERAGFPPEERPFAPHLTLSRIRPHQDVRPLLESVPPFPLRLPVRRVVVFRSHLGGGGPARYEELEAFDLG